MAEEERRPHRVIALDEIEAMPGPATLTWRPVRATLGIRAFGTNAYTAGEPGHDVVEPHTESADLPHEELYFVARGRAVFTIDGDEFEAPAGTYVFVPDPRSHRHAVAAEAGTTVLSFGGPPTFTPSAWEWSFKAEAAKDRPDEARAIIQDGFRTHPDSAALHYALAKLEAREGNAADALRELASALERAPEALEEARNEEAFGPLHGHSEFERLVGTA